MKVVTGIYYVLAEAAKNAKKLLCCKLIMNLVTVALTIIDLLMLKLVVDYVLSESFRYEKLRFYLLAFLLGTSLWSVLGIRFVFRTLENANTILLQIVCRSSIENVWK